MSQFPTKTCPSCNEDVLLTAKRCKVCFHDFVLPSGGSSPVATIGWAFAISALVLSLAWVVIDRTYDQTTLDKVTWDEDQGRIVLVWTSTQESPRTQTLEFSEITRVELVRHKTLLGSEINDVYIHPQDGERILVNRDERDLTAYAEDASRRAQCPLTIDDQVGNDAFGGSWQNEEGSGEAPAGSN